MILEPDPLKPFDAPAGANFSLRFRSPLSSVEMAAATRTVIFTGPDGSQSELSASASGADMLFSVTPGLFSEGEWRFNPRVVSGGMTYGWPVAGVMNIRGPGYSKSGAAC
jgi:hypothetical protein